MPEESFLRLYAQTRRFSSGLPASPRLTPEGDTVLFLRSLSHSHVQSLFSTDVGTGQTRELLSPQALLQGAAERLSTEERARLERQRISARGFTHFQLSRDGTKVALGFSGKLYLLDRASGQVRPLKTGEGVIDPKLSPDGRSIAYVREHDVFVLDLASNRERRLTRGGTARVSHGLAEFVAQEEMSRFSGFWWSPDSRWIAYEEVDNAPVERLTIADAMHPERAADSFPYPRAGKENARTRLGVISARGGKTTWVKWDAARYPYLATVAWQEGGPLSILVQNRSQTEEVLLKVAPSTGKTRPLLEEKDEAWLNLNQWFPRWLEDGSGFFWLTERNGGPEVELRGPDGALRGSWVKPEAGFAAPAGWDPKERALYFTGGPQPTESQLYRVKDGGAPERVSLGEGPPGSVHAVLAKSGSALLVGQSDLTHGMRWSVFSPDGRRQAELPSVALEPPLRPTTEIRKVGDGDGFWAAITRPSRFEKGKKLPVIVDVYGGPHHLQVTRRMDVLEQWMADQGYLVVKFDGRGTPRRGRAWERAIRGDFAGPTLDDQVAALRALAAEVPELDLSRVGVVGWSFGGYMAALAVMKRPDVFKAAVAGAPVVDWLDYDTHYTERYLGLPQEAPQAYQRSSLLTYAEKLERPLLLLHGTADDNVYFFHSLKLSNALFRAGRPHQLLPLSGLTHMVPDPLVTERLWEQVMRFFREHLQS